MTKTEYTYEELEELVIEVIKNAEDWRIWSEAVAEAKTNATDGKGAISLANRYGKQLDEARDELLAYLKSTVEGE